MLLVISSLIWLPPEARQTAYQKEQFDWLFEMLGHNVSAGFFKIKRGGKCQSRSLSAQSIQSGLSAQWLAEPAHRTTALSLPGRQCFHCSLPAFILKIWRHFSIRHALLSPSETERLQVKAIKLFVSKVTFAFWKGWNFLLSCLLIVIEYDKQTKKIPRTTYVIHLDYCI